MNKHLLEVNHLEVSIDTYRGEVKAVRDVSFQIDKGQVFCIVGESGCGKSVTAQTLMKLNPSSPTKIKNGQILFQGDDIVKMDKKHMKKIRGREISMIFQDPMTCLNPTQRVGKQIEEAIKLHSSCSLDELQRKVIEMLEFVSVPSPKERAKQYPHEFSGGMRQRVMIAMGLACEPKLLIADEPTTALDVTIQAQILELIKKLQKEKNISVLLITHDLGVVANMADVVAVMYAGKIVEMGTCWEVMKNPKHPYTKALLAAKPKSNQSRQEKLTCVEGMPPSLLNPPKGCGFAERCPDCRDCCREKMPKTVQINNSHKVSCYLYSE